MDKPINNPYERKRPYHHITDRTDNSTKVDRQKHIRFDDLKQMWLWRAVMQQEIHQRLSHEHISKNPFGDKGRIGRETESERGAEWYQLK